MIGRKYGVRRRLLKGVEEIWDWRGLGVRRTNLDFLLSASSRV